MQHTITGAKARVRGDRGPLFCRAAAPRGGKAREHRVAARLLALFVARAVALPIEIGPGVALLCLDVAAKLDAFARQLHEETRWWVHVRVAEERSPARVREIRAIFRARDADRTEAALLLELRLFSAGDRPDVREDPLLHAGHEHDRELETLDGMHGDKGRRGFGVLVFVDVGHERDLLEEARQLLLLGQRDIVLGEGAELLHVGPTLLALLGPVL